jgi:hypothetical protein
MVEADASLISSVITDEEISKGETLEHIYFYN